MYFIRKIFSLRTAIILGLMLVVGVCSFSEILTYFLQKNIQLTPTRLSLHSSEYSIAYQDDFVHVVLPVVEVQHSSFSSEIDSVFLEDGVVAIQTLESSEENTPALASVITQLTEVFELQLNSPVHVDVIRIQNLKILYEDFQENVTLELWPQFDGDVLSALSGTLRHHNTKSTLQFTFDTSTRALEISSRLLNFHHYLPESVRQYIPEEVVTLDINVQSIASNQLSSTVHITSPTTSIASYLHVQDATANFHTELQHPLSNLRLVGSYTATENDHFLTGSLRSQNTRYEDLQLQDATLFFSMSSQDQHGTFASQLQNMQYTFDENEISVPSAEVYGDCQNERCTLQTSLATILLHTPARQFVANNLQVSAEASVSGEVSSTISLEKFTDNQGFVMKELEFSGESTTENSVFQIQYQNMYYDSFTFEAGSGTLQTDFTTYTLTSQLPTPFGDVQVDVTSDLKDTNAHLSTTTGFLDTENLYMYLPDSLTSLAANFSGDVYYTDSMTQSASLRVEAHVTDARIIDDMIQADGIQMEIQAPDLLHSTTSYIDTTIRNLHIKEFVVENLELKARTDSAKTFYIDRLLGEWCQGLVEARNLEYNSETNSVDIVVYASEIRVDEMFQQAGVGTASGTSTLNGRLPITFHDDKIEVTKGFLFSTPGADGTVQFQKINDLREGLSGAVSAGVVEYTLQSLSDFKYNWITLAFDTTDNTLDLSLRLDGEPAEPLPFAYSNGDLVHSPTAQMLHPIQAEINFHLPILGIRENWKIFQNILNQVQP